MDTRTRRDGRAIEELGFYDPVVAADKEATFTLNEERAKYWLSVGATPSETVASLLVRKGLELPSKKGKKKSAKAAS